MDEGIDETGAPPPEFRNQHGRKRPACRAGQPPEQSQCCDRRSCPLPVEPSKRGERGVVETSSHSDPRARAMTGDRSAGREQAPDRSSQVRTRRHSRQAQDVHRSARCCRQRVGRPGPPPGGQRRAHRRPRRAASRCRSRWASREAPHEVVRRAQGENLRHAQDDDDDAGASRR